MLFGISLNFLNNALGSFSQRFIKFNIKALFEVTISVLNWTQVCQLHCKSPIAQKLLNLQQSVFGQ